MQIHMKRKVAKIN